MYFLFQPCYHLAIMEKWNNIAQTVLGYLQNSCGTQYCTSQYRGITIILKCCPTLAYRLLLLKVYSWNYKDCSTENIKQYNESLHTYCKINNRLMSNNIAAIYYTRVHTTASFSTYTNNKIDCLVLMCLLGVCVFIAVCVCNMCKCIYVLPVSGGLERTSYLWFVAVYNQ